MPGAGGGEEFPATATGAGPGRREQVAPFNRSCEQDSGSEPAEANVVMEAGRSGGGGGGRAMRVFGVASAIVDRLCRRRRTGSGATSGRRAAKRGCWNHGTEFRGKAGCAAGGDAAIGHATESGSRQSERKLDGRGRETAACPGGWVQAEWSRSPRFREIACTRARAVYAFQSACRQQNPAWTRGTGRTASGTATA